MHRRAIQAGEERGLRFSRMDQYPYDKRKSMRLLWLLCLVGNVTEGRVAKQCGCFSGATTCQVDCGCPSCRLRNVVVEGQLWADSFTQTTEKGSVPHLCAQELKVYLARVRTPPVSSLTDCGSCLAWTSTCLYEECPPCHSLCDAWQPCERIADDNRRCFINQTKGEAADRLTELCAAATYDAPTTMVLFVVVVVTSFLLGR